MSDKPANPLFDALAAQERAAIDHWITTMRGDDVSVMVRDNLRRSFAQEWKADPEVRENVLNHYMRSLPPEGRSH
jgi:hypothetical protein